MFVSKFVCKGIIVKLVVFVLLAVFGAVFANGIISDVSEIHGSYPGYPGTDDIIDSYAINEGELHTTSYASFHATGQSDPYITADDFEITVDAQVDEIVYWYTSSDNPATCDVFLYADAAPGPGAQLQATTATVAAVQTSIPWGSAWIHECTLTLAAPLTFDLGSVYWIAPLRDEGGAEWFCNVGSTVRGTECYLQYQGVWGPWSAQSQPVMDVFRIMYGNTSSLERTTWGSIKNLF